MVGVQAFKAATPASPPKAESIARPLSDWIIMEVPTPVAAAATTANSSFKVYAVRSSARFLAHNNSAQVKDKEAARTITLEPLSAYKPGAPVRLLVRLRSK